jgi:SAM-dependent methyltransferase
MEDFYGYPSTKPASFWRRIRRFILWPEKVRRMVAGNMILPWVGRGRLLDVGCGSGVNTMIFKAQGWDVFGLDLNEVAVGHARTLLGDRVQVGDFQTVCYPDRAFDVVRLSHSLEHMYNLSRVFAEVRRILDDDGMVTIAPPNAGSLEARLFGRWWFPWELPRHLYHFERKTIVRLLGQAGFSVVRFKTGVTPAHFMTSLERVYTYMLGRKLPTRRLIEKLIARPICLLAGNLGYGTELIIYAVKASGAIHRAADTSEASASASSS